MCLLSPYFLPLLGDTEIRESVNIKGLRLGTQELNIYVHADDLVLINIDL